MNKLVTFGILIAVVLTVATATTTIRVQSAFAWFANCKNCAREFTPGNEAKFPGDEQNVAPGQLGKSSDDAKDFAPGHRK